VKDAILAPPKLTLAQKWHNLPSGTKLAIYCGAGGGAALLFSLILCGCVRQRRRGRRERAAFNAKVEQEREQAYQDQIQLREKGLGGWDAKEYATLGEDALGGWGGAHAAPGAKTDEADPSPILEPPTAVTAAGIDHYGARSNSPALSRTNTAGAGFDNYGSHTNSPGISRTNTAGFDNYGSRMNSPAISRTNTAGFDNYGSQMNSPAVSRMNTPGPRMMSPAPMAAPQPQRTWNGASQGAMNPEITSYGSSRNNNSNMGQSPNFPLASPQGMGRGPSRGGYERF
jgi:hypothetical protein